MKLSDLDKIVITIIIVMVGVFFVVSSKVPAFLGADPDVIRKAIGYTLLGPVSLAIGLSFLNIIGPMGILVTIGVFGWPVWWEVLDNMANKLPYPVWWNGNLTKWGIECTVILFAMHLVYKRK